MKVYTIFQDGIYIIKAVYITSNTKNYDKIHDSNSARKINDSNEWYKITLTWTAQQVTFFY